MIKTKELRVLFLGALCTLGSIQAIHAQTKINGTLKGKSEATLYVNYVGEKGYRSEELAVKNGKFTWEKPYDFPVSVNFSLTNNRMGQSNAASLWTDPGQLDLTLDAANLSNYVLKGSSTDQLARTFQAIIQAETDQMVALTARAQTAQNNGTDQNDQRKLREEYGALTKKMAEKQVRFLEQHPASQFSASLLYQAQQSLSPEELNRYLGLLKGDAAKSQYANRIRYDIAGELNGVVGAQAPLFSGTDINGNAFALADLIGKKYVLVDFWASWCVPCRQGNPHLKELHNKYKSKGLEVVLVADNDGNPDEWRKAVAQDQIEQFTHVLRGWKGMEYFFDRQDISGKYGVKSLPTKVLIGKDGKIIGRYGGGGENDAAMDKKLAEIFGE